MKQYRAAKMIEWMARSGDPKVFVAVAIGCVVLMISLVIFVVLRRNVINPKSKEEDETTSRLKAAVEAAVLTRKHIQHQRHTFETRMGDKRAKYSAVAVEDLGQMANMISDRLKNAAKILGSN